MAKQITIDTVLAAINEGEALGCDMKGKIEGSKIAMFDNGHRYPRRCGYINVVNGALDMSGAKLPSVMFSKAEGYILAKIA
jgi:hypothetical protein